MIPIYEPYLTPEILKYAHDALDSGWISSLGKYKPMAEEILTEKLDAKYAILTNNGTSATHLVAKTLRCFHPIQHVVVPNNTYVALWNALTYDRFVWQMVPIDADLGTWNIKYPTDLIKDKPTTAFMITHNLGNIVNVPRLKRLYPSCIFVEDNCEGLFGKYEGIPTGKASICYSISFFGNKNITTGEGGAFLTDSEDLYNYAKKIHFQGTSEERYIFDCLGYNYRMTNVQAAILYGQLLHSDEILEKKAYLFDRYTKALRGHDNIRLQVKEPETDSANWLFGVRITGSEFKRAHKFFADQDIDVRPMFYPITRHKHLSSIKCDITNASILAKECFEIPSSPKLTDEEIDYIIKTVKDYAQIVLRNEF